METAITRRDFLKKMMFGFAGVLAVAKFGGGPVVTQVKEVISEGNIVQGEVPPIDHSKMWLNTGSGENTLGINGTSIPSGAMCYWDCAGNCWRASTATWA